MGQTMSDRVLGDISPDNGYLLGTTYMPYELLALILSYVDKKSLTHKCMYVCKLWREIIDEEVWKIKAERESLHSLRVKRNKRLPSSVYKRIVWKDPFERNLIKNGDGSQRLEHWKIIHNGGNKWDVETPPVGVISDENDELKYPSSCFVTSYGKCAKMQIVDFYQEGIDRSILDTYKLPITVSEWYASRWDCNAKYTVTIQLIGANDEVIEEFTHRDVSTEWGSGWKKVQHVFKNYRNGARYIRFVHTGRDMQFWAGHYGSKMTGASVIVSLNNLTD